MDDDDACAKAKTMPDGRKTLRERGNARVATVRFTPFWAIFVGTLLVALLAVEGGYTWARYRRQHSTTEREREKEAPC